MAGRNVRGGWCVRRVARWAWSPVFALALLAGCGGGGGEEGGSVPEPQGWVTISEPANDAPYPYDCDWLRIAGSAFISEGWFHCGEGGCDPGVTVTWANRATGVAGTAFSAMSCLPLLGLCTHSWWFNVDVATGENLIDVVAIDPSGVQGTDRLTVVKSRETYDLTGRFVTTDGLVMGVGNSRVRVLLSGTESRVLSPDYEGFGASCLYPGQYTLTPESPFSHVWTPARLEVEIVDADVTGLEFTTEAWLLSGRVLHANGLPDTFAVVNLSDDMGLLEPLFVGEDGFYRMGLPNGAWRAWAVSASDYSPSSQSFTIDGADVVLDDFRAY